MSEEPNDNLDAKTKGGEAEKIDLAALMNKLMAFIPDEERLTFLAKKVKNIILRCKEKYPEVNIEITSHREMGLYNSAIRVDFKDTNYVFNVITASGSTGGDFCESAILSKETSEIYYAWELGYGDVVRHEDEAVFEKDMLEIFQKLPNHKPEKIDML
ncbi:MAG: hypothetical protein Hyperionvirus6_94 [Hyperionvirus sp.]|uniref:Uncharacterized protein n=1 Tax=Hyperionvirus sp. TaxID=2487770 RepID=A0A3G5AC16_9VIRU|nr:MAG: hypothetical protein Hyperionvirus6_94 [Hyperionvirus sp.]